MYYLLGGSGYHNFGDELMVKGWLHQLTRNGIPASKIIVDGSSQDKLKSAFESLVGNVQFTDQINKLSQKSQFREFWKNFKRGATFYERGGFDKYPNLKKSPHNILNASIIHLHGGGYLNKHFAKKGFLLGLAISTSLKTGSTLVGTGIGLVPLDPPPAEMRDQVRKYLEVFEFIETRDKESAEILKNISPEANIISGVDDTFIDTITYDGDGLHRLHISWNYRQTGTAEFKNTLRYVAENLQRYDEATFWHCAKNDNGTWDILSSAFPKIRNISFQQLISEPLPISRGDHMLTARFHPHLIAARGGATGGYFSPGQYYDIKHGSICSIGSGFFNIASKDLTDKTFGSASNSLFDNTSVICRNKEFILQSILDKVKKGM